MTVPPWTLLVLAKQPRPGYSKTRLSPPLTPADAALIAEASLRDTLDAASQCGAAHVMVALAGNPAYLSHDTQLAVFEQQGRDLNERLEQAWRRTSGWVVQIGSDTPQLCVQDLDEIAASLVDHDAVLGPAEDGGWWALAQREHKEGLFASVKMSTAATFDAQLASLRARHRRVGLAKPMRDLDLWDDALEIARRHPSLRTSALVRTLGAA